MTVVVRSAVTEWFRLKQGFKVPAHRSTVL